MYDMNIFRRVLTWAYVKYVYIPLLHEKLGAADLNPHGSIRLVVSKVDQNWDQIEAAEYEKRFNTIQ